MLVDGDTFYTRDIVAQFRSIAPSSGAVFCFLAPHNTPIFSYIKRYWPSSDSPSRLSVTQRALASPSELLASPSELLASPSELLTSPSELLASPSESS
jgi:hypothetical protein